MSQWKVVLDVPYYFMANGRPHRVMLSTTIKINKTMAKSSTMTNLEKKYSYNHSSNQIMK